MPVGSSDAALAPYHVDRSKLFVVERLDAVDEVDAGRIARAIEYTRFPYADTPKGDIDDLNEEEGLLLRAADLIGQLGDPNYMRKSNRLFHEFEQLDQGPGRRYQGSGLGLSLTKKLVELHGGTIDVVSELGKGTTFTIVLPYALDGHAGQTEAAGAMEA